jgi:hypothetical protein
MPVALVYGWYVYNYPTCTFRYKLTAEVMTPDGLKTGSSVIEVSYSSTHPLPNPGRWSADTLTGEAVYVDLGKGKNLFILLGVDRWERQASKTPGRQPRFDGIEGGQDRLTEEQLGEGSLNALWLPVHVFKLGRSVGEEREMRLRANALLGQTPVEVPSQNLPMVVSFSDLSKPETLRVLRPPEITDVLGQDYSLQSVKMQIVRDSPSAHLEETLGWLNSSTNFLLLKCEKNATELRSGKCWANKGYFKTTNQPPVNLN